jgi:hypothetical protein
MPLIAISYIALALSLGYGVTVGLSLAATFGITAASRSFVSKNYRIRKEYKYVQEAVWLLCCMAGAYAAAMVNEGSHAVVVATGLFTLLVGVLWLNVWEVRQRGLGHQISMTIASALGVAAGFMLRLR